MNETWWVNESQLDDDQRQIIELPVEGNYLVVGPPGSGKTNLLLLRANYMYLAGQANIAVIVFTRSLHDFIDRGSENYNFPVDKIQTCVKWQHDLLHAYGVDIPPPDSFGKRRIALLENMERLVEKKKLRNVYDAILLDEAQDYLPGEIQIFRKLARSLFVVADSRQKIYKGDDPLDTITSLVTAKCELRHHYRNGRAICRLADALAKDSDEYVPLIPTSNYDENARPSSVDHFSCKNIQDQTAKIIAKLETQLKAYPDEAIGVLCPRNSELNEVYGILMQSPLAPYVALNGDEIPFLADQGIIVSTFHDAKGLEFRAVHLAGCEFIRRFAHQRNMTFTGVTRAKTSLSLYYAAPVPGFLEKALKTLEPKPSLPKVKDVFGGKK